MVFGAAACIVTEKRVNTYIYPGTLYAPAAERRLTGAGSA